MARAQPTGRSDSRPRPQALRSLFRVVRFENCLFAYVATAIGFASAGDSGAPTWRLVLAGTVVALVLAFDNVVNDLFDEDADRRSKPWRPLPSGRISRRQASNLALVLALAALPVGMPLGRVPVGFSLVMLVLAYQYSARLKRIPLAGNAVVALQVGSTILFGALCAGDPTAATLIGAALVMLYSLTLEVAKTIEDEHADRAVGVTTVAHLMTRSGQGALVLGLSGMSASAAVGSGLALGAPPTYWLVLAPLVPLAWLGARWHMTTPPSSVRLRPLVGASKALWLLALVGLTTIT